MRTKLLTKVVPVILAGKVNYLLRDVFTDTLTAGNVNGTDANPGPGTRAVVDGSSVLSLTGGKLSMVGINDAQYNDPVYNLDAVTRAAGVMFKVTMDQPAHINYVSALGFWSAAPGASINDARGVFFYTAGGVLRLRNSGESPDCCVVAASTTYEAAVILRSSGVFGLIKGGVYTEWTLYWVSNAQTTTPVYPGIGVHANTITYTFDNVAVAQMATPWDSDDGIVTDSLAGSRAPGDTFTHEADCIIEFEVDALPTGGQIEVWFRIQDGTNYWCVTVDSAGNIDLDEVVASGVTQRGTSAAIVANSDRIVIIADDEEIRVYEGANGENLRITYSSAANFKTETDGELDTEGTAGAVSAIKSWPRVLSGAALSEVSKY